MSGTFIYLGKEPHVCATPGWRERRRAKVLLHAVWVCECGTGYQWVRSAYDGDMHWHRLTEQQLSLRLAK